MDRPPELYGEYVAGEFRAPPFDRALWEAFLVDRGVGLGLEGFGEPVARGMINANYRVVDADGSVAFLRWYRMRDLDAVRAELALIQYLTGAGFPTPAVRPGLDGELARDVRGWPAALFDFGDGGHIDGGADKHSLRHLPVAGDVARCVAQLGVLTGGYRLGGGRRLDPESQIELFARHVAGDSVLASVPGVALLAAQLTDVSQRFRSAVPDTLPSGVVHRDAHDANVLVDAAGRLQWLLDFDDATTSPLVFDLVAMFPYWARNSVESLDPEAVGRLADSYQQERPLQRAERLCVTEAALLHMGGEVASHLTWHTDALRDRREQLGDSYSYLLFQGMLDSQDWRGALAEAVGT